MVQALNEKRKASEGQALFLTFQRCNQNLRQTTRAARTLATAPSAVDQQVSTVRLTCNTPCYYGSAPIDLSAWRWNILQQ